jgi:hypothetical protein
MTNRITRIEIRNRSLTPAEAEVWLIVHAESVTSTTDVRGRLMGPSCPFSSTIEVAYPLRLLPHPPADVPPLTRRVVIPEPSFWDAESPFLYHGPVELWQDGQRCERVTMSHGLCSSSLTQHGLRWNGKALPLRGRAVHGLTEDQALSLRHSGFNLLLAPVNEPQTWEIADWFGFLVLGDIPCLDETALRRVAQLTPHPSCFGWLVNSIGVNPMMVPHLERLGVVGTEGHTLPAHTAFVVCSPAQVRQFADRKLPLLVRGEFDAIVPPVIGCMW